MKRTAAIGLMALLAACERQPAVEPSAPEMLAAIAPLQRGPQGKIAIRKIRCRPVSLSAFECAFVPKLCGEDHPRCVGGKLMQATFVKAFGRWTARDPRGPVGALPEYVHEVTPAKSQDEWDREWEDWQRDIVLPVDPKHRRLELTPQWLEGYWVVYKSACYGSDSGIHFSADGTYADHETDGRYAIDREHVRMTVVSVHNAPDDSEVGTSERIKVVPIGPNEILTGWRDERDQPLRLYRCPREPLAK